MTSRISLSARDGPRPVHWGKTEDARDGLNENCAVVAAWCGGRGQERTGKSARATKSRTRVRNDKVGWRVRNDRQKAKMPATVRGLQGARVKPFKNVTIGCVVGTFEM